LHYRIRRLPRKVSPPASGPPRAQWRRVRAQRAARAPVTASTVVATLPSAQRTWTACPPARALGETVNVGCQAAERAGAAVTRRVNAVEATDRTRPPEHTAETVTDRPRAARAGWTPTPT